MSGAAHGPVRGATVETAVHRAAPEPKVLALLAFVVAVALVPRGVFWPYAVDAALLATIAGCGRVSPRALAPRLLVEAPFVLVVALLPFVTAGREVDVLGVGLSRDGLELAAAIAAKATLAVLASGVLAATTPAPAILAGLTRLGVPRQLTAIAGFALRYLEVVLDELRRMRLARIARGDDPRWLWQARAVARCAGALAVRCFERGERVHVAMLARGFDGRMPDLVPGPRATAPAWGVAVAVPLAALAATVVASWGWAP